MLLGAAPAFHVHESEAGDFYSDELERPGLASGLDGFSRFSSEATIFSSVTQRVVCFLMLLSRWAVFFSAHF